MSQTPLPGGEAQLAEVRTNDGRIAIIFNSRVKSALKRGVAWSYDFGKSFTDIHEAEDLTGGASCDSSILSLDQHPVGYAEAANSSSLLFSHPSGKNRTHKAGRNAGVLLRSDDNAVRTHARSRIRPIASTGSERVTWWHRRRGMKWAQPRQRMKAQSLVTCPC